MMSFKQMSKHFRQFTMAQFKPSIFIFIFAVTFFGFMVSMHYTGNRHNKAQFRDVFDADHVEKSPKIWPTTDDSSKKLSVRIPI
ncbi:unnamed protein product [Caenorhabditis brenneri]